MRVHAVLRGGLAAVACLVAGAAFLILGIAGVSWRAQCANAPGAGLCGGEATPPAIVAEEAEFVVAEVDPVATGAIDATVPGVTAVTVQPPNPVVVKLQAADKWIAGTFEQLAEIEPGAAVKAAIAPPAASAPTKRKVQTVAIDANGKPVLPQDDAVAETALMARGGPAVSAAAAADEIAAPLATPEPLAFASWMKPAPAGDPIDPPDASETVVAPIPATRTIVASAAAEAEPAAAVEEPTAAASDVRKVKGKGVNVRSGPASSSGKVFALGGGERVTVLDKERGWLKIKDARGRSGWVYSDYVS